MQKMIASDDFVEFQAKMEEALKVINTEVIMLGSQVRAEDKLDNSKIVYRNHWWAIIERK